VDQTGATTGTTGTGLTGSATDTVGGAAGDTLTEDTTATGGGYDTGALPDTASELPLLALIGLLALGAVAVVKRF
jgi:hypothetical protein